MKTFLKVMFFLVLIIVGVSAFLMYGVKSDGHRAGQVIKLSRKGLIFKTYEGQLNTGGGFSMSDGDITSSIWEFSVYNHPEVVGELEDALAKGGRVKLHYIERYIKIPFRGDTNYFVDSVEFIK